MLSPRKISFDDAHGSWFWSEDYQDHLYVIYVPYSISAESPDLSDSETWTKVGKTVGRISGSI